MPPSLAAVKAEIKTWERAFRAKHDRNPTREDIKARRDIADKYSLYKKLVKAAAEGESTTQSLGPNKKELDKGKHPGTIAAPLESAGLQESPLQTPKKNKSSDRWRRPTNPVAGATEDTLMPQEKDEVSINNPFLSPTKKLQSGPSSQASLKEAKSYPTPVSDPAHRNPFEDDIVEGKGKGTPRKRDKEGDAPTFQSPSKQAFLFAPSPKRLKSLLEVNSLHASSSSRDPMRSAPMYASPAKIATLPAITPRTRARKRLRGEEVEDTPEKDGARDGKSLKIGSRWAQARSLRLQRSTGFLEESLMKDGIPSTEGKDPQSIKRINVWKRNVQEETGTTGSRGTSDLTMQQFSEDEDDEALGPTPVKNPGNYSINGATSGKRLFIDMLLPLGDTVNTQSSTNVAFRQPFVASPSNNIRQSGPHDTEDSHVDATEAANRTPSKAMSRFMASKPKSRLSPLTASHDSVAYVRDAPVPMDMVTDASIPADDEIFGPGDKLDDTLPPDSTDSDDEERITLETVDVEELDVAPAEANTQKEWTSSQKALTKEISLSDDESEGGNRGPDLDGDSQMDGGGGKDSSLPRGGRKLRIESYRYALQQKIAEQRMKRKNEIFDENDFEHMQETRDGEGDDGSSGRNVGNQPDPFHALSKLSIQSPESKVIRKTMALQQARAKAIFDGRTRERLRAAKRAPVYGAGEGTGRGHTHAEDEDVGMGLGRQRDADPFAEEGDDDDWESEAEGWKATGLPDDDDW